MAGYQPAIATIAGIVIAGALLFAIGVPLAGRRPSIE
jgi:hypothetical protein